MGIEQLGSARGLDALQEKIESAMSSSNKFNEFDVFMSSQLFMGQSAYSSGRVSCQWRNLSAFGQSARERFVVGDFPASESLWGR